MYHINISYIKTVSNCFKKGWETHYYFLSEGPFARELSVPPISTQSTSFNFTHGSTRKVGRLNSAAPRLRAEWFGLVSSWYLLVLDCFPISSSTVLAVLFQVLLTCMSCITTFASPHPLDLRSLASQSHAVLSWCCLWRLLSSAWVLCSCSWHIASHLDFKH